jgi:hypothetical protein
VPGQQAIVDEPGQRDLADEFVVPVGELLGRVQRCAQ